MVMPGPCPSQSIKETTGTDPNSNIIIAIFNYDIASMHMYVYLVQESMTTETTLMATYNTRMHI